MFGFKRKKKDVQEDNQPLEVDPEQKKIILEEINNLQDKITDNLASEDKAEILNQIGMKYEQINDADNAIQIFEESMAVKEQFGDAYNSLLKLYENKRKIAAKNKNDSELQKWVSKTDELLNISKRVMRSSLSK